jgi:hypothetical protein
MQSCTSRGSPGRSITRPSYGSPRQDGRQARLVLDREAPAQRIADQAVHRHGAQQLALAVEPQQRHGAAAEMQAQRFDQPLLAHGDRQLGRQIREQQGVDGGHGR